MNENRLPDYLDHIQQAAAGHLRADTLRHGACGTAGQTELHQRCGLTGQSEQREWIERAQH